jgi:SAM-dependent methyltransferase
VKKKLNIVTPLHQSTKREYLARMNDNKVEAMLIAKKYGEQYWDGNRRYGYGGYRYIPGRWKPVAEELIKQYNLTNNSKILDVGCGKAFLLYEIQLLLPGAKLVGMDISQYGLNSKHPDFKGNLFIHRAQDYYPFENKEFDLVISITTLHNLRLPELEIALKEIERVGKQAYVMLESYRNELEMFNLECWALTAESLLDEEEWIWLYNHFGYTGDYEFIFFE